MTDHKDEAQRQLYRVEGRYMDQPKSQFVIDATLASAQVHATLYLAEQQRAANLIALLVAEGDVAGVDYGKVREQIIASVIGPEARTDG